MDNQIQTLKKRQLELTNLILDIEGADSDLKTKQTLKFNLYGDKAIIGIISQSSPISILDGSIRLKVFPVEKNKIIKRYRAIDVSSLKNIELNSQQFIIPGDLRAE